MFKNFILKMVLLFGVFFISVGCNDWEVKELFFPIDSSQLNYRHDFVNGVFANNCESSLVIPEKYKGRDKVFNQQEINIPVKGDNFGLPYVGVGIYYYELGQFNYDDNTYRLIIYKKTGEADTPLLNVQLNSYDLSDNLVDALLVDSFFCYEDIVRFSDFTINSDYTISIDGYVVYRYEVDENGLGGKIKNPTPQVYLKEKYQIENGRFKLIVRMENKVK